MRPLPRAHLYEGGERVLRDVVPLLACPHCGAGLWMDGGTLRCCRGHAFDVARQGYVSLLSGAARPGTGDTATMVAARAAFLGAGHFRPAADTVAVAAARIAAQGPGSIVDIGAGTGYFLAAALDAADGGSGDRLGLALESGPRAGLALESGPRAGLALDASKYAARRAARAHPRIGAVVCDAWRRLPVRSGTAAVALVVLAPRNAGEIRRLLRPGGALVLVTPTPRHLRELVEPLGLLTVDERKSERLEAQLEPHFAPAGEQVSEYRMELSHGEVRQLVAMGPSARHTSGGALDKRIGPLPEPVAVTASFAVATYRPRESR